MLCTVAVKNIGCYYIRMTKMKFVIGRNKTSQSVTVGDTELYVKFKTKWTHFSGLKFESVVCRIVDKTTKLTVVEPMINKLFFQGTCKHFFIRDLFTLS